MIFESKQEYDELVEEVEQDLENSTKKKKKVKPKKEEGIGGTIPFADVLPPSFGHKSGKKHDAWVEGFESRILKILKEQEAVGEVQPMGTLGHNNPRVDPYSTPGKKRRAKSDDYGSTRKGEGTPESQKKEFGAKGPLEKLAEKLASETETADEIEQDQQKSEEETP